MRFRRSVHNGRARRASVSAILVLALALPSLAEDGPKIDPEADRVLRAFSETILGLDEFRTKFTAYVRAKAGSSRGGGTFCDFDIAVRRPNMVTLDPRNAREEITLVSDGETLHVNLPESDRYIATDPPKRLIDAVDLSKLTMFDFNMSLAGPIHILLADDPYAYLMEGVKEVQYVGRDRFTGTECHQIRLIGEAGQVDYWFEARGKPMLVRMLPDPPPPLPRITIGVAGRANPADTELSYTFKNWKTKRKIPDRVFRFKAPKRSELVDFDTAIASVSSGGKPLLGEAAPKFKLDQYGGGEVDLASHVGRDVVILDFWASWCGPCRMGMPIIDEVAGRFKDKGVVFYAVNLREDASVVEGYLKSTGLKLNVLMDQRGSVGGKYGVGGIPHTVVIGKDGKVRDVHIGFSNALRDELTKTLEKLIAE